MNHYAIGLVPDNPRQKLLIASGTQLNRTLYTYPNVPDLQAWESHLYDDGVEVVDEDGDEVPVHILIAQLDHAPSLRIQHETQPVI